MALTHQEFLPSEPYIKDPIGWSEKWRIKNKRKKIREILIERGI